MLDQEFVVPIREDNSYNEFPMSHPCIIFVSQLAYREAQLYHSVHNTTHDDPIHGHNTVEPEAIVGILK